MYQIVFSRNRSIYKVLLSKPDTSSPRDGSLCPLSSNLGVTTLTNGIWWKQCYVTSQARSLKGYSFHLALSFRTLAFGTQIPYFREAQATRRSDMWVFWPTVPVRPSVNSQHQLPDMWVKSLHTLPFWSFEFSSQNHPQWEAETRHPCWACLNSWPKKTAENNKQLSSFKSPHIW